MAPLRTVETLDQIAERIEDGGRKLKKLDRRVLNALQTFDLTELVGSMLNTLHSSLERQTKQIVNHQTFATAAQEANVSLSTLMAAFTAVNGNGAGELYPKDALIAASTDTGLMTQRRRATLKQRCAARWRSRPTPLPPPRTELPSASQSRSPSPRPRSSNSSPRRRRRQAGRRPPMRPDLSATRRLRRR